jgi:hypothetical protein
MLDGGGVVGYGPRPAETADSVEIIDADTTTYPLTGDVVDFTVTGDTVFIAVKGPPHHVYVWRPKSGTAPQVLATVRTTAVSGVSFTEAVVIKSDSTLALLAGGTEQAIAFSSGTPVAVFARTIDDIYVAVNETNGATVYRLTRQLDASWLSTKVAELDDGKAVHFDGLPDGSLVLSGTTRFLVLCTIATTPTVCGPAPGITTGASRASGTSMSDIWLANASARAPLIPGLVHYDGTLLDLAPLSLGRGATSVSATSELVLVGGGSAVSPTVHVLVRFDLSTPGAP